MTTSKDFPPYPGRPDHPDFWRLSDIVIDHDAKVETGTGIEQIIGQYVDIESLRYMVFQRAAKALSQVPGDASQGLVVAAAILDGFVMGAAFERTRKGEPRIKNS